MPAAAPPRPSPARAAIARWQARVRTDGALAFADLSGLPRSGAKGPGTPGWLAAQGIVLPAAPNRAVRQEGGRLVALLSASEALILAPRGTPALPPYGDGAPRAPGVYPVAREEGTYWFRLGGAPAAAALAKLCAVDLRPARFADGEVAQTSVARTSCVVIRDDDGGRTSAFHLLGDITLAEHVAEALLDAAAEFGVCIGGA